MNVVSSAAVAVRGKDPGQIGNDRRWANRNTTMLFNRCRQELNFEGDLICINRRDGVFTHSGNILHGFKIYTTSIAPFYSIYVDIDYGHPLTPKYLLRRYRNHEAVMFTYLEASVLIHRIQSYILAWGNLNC